MPCARAIWLAFLVPLGLSLLASACDDDDHNDQADDDDDDNNDNDDSSPPEEYDYDVPVKATSPWPAFRRTSRHTGRSPITPEPNGLVPWAFQTEKGFFHEPVIDEDGTVYYGSGDTFFYAINPDGTEKWRFATGEMLDSTAIVAADGTIFVPAGDGNVYALTPAGEELWRLPAEGEAGFITWWEGHIAMGPDGTLYAGNDDRRLYAFSQAADVRWTYRSVDQVWSCPAVDAAGNLYYGANDFIFRSLTPAGQLRWWNVTLGPVASSPAISDDGSLVVVGSFDGYVHAFDPATGDPLWRFAARDHIYGSPAIGGDGTIYVGSADGTMYALNPDGTRQWAFDTLDPIRSSASIDGDGNLYFGCGDGKLYALNPDGTKRWSFDTTTGDRNDLNAMPAIGKTGVVIGSENGQVVFVPFGYCETSGDERCDTSPGESVPDDGAFLFYYTNGGSSRDAIEAPVVPTEVLSFRLVVREGGDTVRARLKPATLDVTTTPPFASRLEVSADGAFVSIIPNNPLPMDRDYQITISGRYWVGGWRLGNRVFGGKVGGEFARTFDFRTAAPTGRPLPLTLDDERASVLLLRRMAAPQPPMLTTFNQIGFDSYNYLLAPVALDPDERRWIALAVEGTPGLDPTINYDTISIFTMNGAYRDSYFDLAGQGFAIDVSGVSIAMQYFRVGGWLQPDRTADDLDVYAEVNCGDIEFFGLALYLLGLCNPETDKLIVNGTALVAPAREELGVRPAALAVEYFGYEPTGGQFGGGYFEARFSANDLDAATQLPVIVVIHRADGEAISLPYGTSLERLADGAQHLAGVRLHLPDTFSPEGLRAVVLVNLYPIYAEDF